MNQVNLALFRPEDCLLDHESDSIIQASIRKELKEVTLIIVAHRLKTVMDADRIASYFLVIFSCL